MSDAATRQESVNSDKPPSFLEILILSLITLAVLFYFVCLFRTCMPFLGRYLAYVT
jgi:hypothetical protein